MIRLLWKKRMYVLAAILFVFLLLNVTVLDTRQSQGEPTVRQILQVSDSALVRHEEAAAAVAAATVKPGAGQEVKKPHAQVNTATAAVKAQHPPQVQVIHLTKPPPPKPLPSGKPKLLGGFPDSAPGLPGVSSYLPHLKDNPSLLSPAQSLSKGKTNVSMVIGIPSIRRPFGTYLYQTLKSLLDGMDASDKADTLIIVCISEPWNATYVNEAKQELQKRFQKELAEGLLEMVVPNAGFYPNLGNLPLTLGDNPTRVKWRTKQNLDYAFLMTHAWTRGQYYLQLEDDVQATNGYIKSMKKAVSTNHGDWVLLEFSTLGFIGRLFHASDIPKMVEFLLMFHTQKPCDWLMEDYLQVRMCGHGEKWAKCLYKIRSVARPIRPSLFQHLGFRSSLQGHVNKLKDKHFSGLNNGTTSALPNPPVANIFTSLSAYANDVYDAYTSEKIFWATIPKEGDVIEFMYSPPIFLERITITTGDERHPTDILTNAVVEILPVTTLSRPALSPTVAAPGKIAQVKRAVQKRAWEERSNTILDVKALAKNADECEAMFVQVGKFNSTGRAEVVQSDVGPVWSVRVRVLGTSNKWLIVKKISIKVRSPES